jgi:hypothetical protein
MRRGTSRSPNPVPDTCLGTSTPVLRHSAMANSAIMSFPQIKARQDVAPEELSDRISNVRGIRRPHQNVPDLLTVQQSEKVMMMPRSDDS